VQAELHAFAKDTSWQKAMMNLSIELIGTLEMLAAEYGVSVATVIHQLHQAFNYVRRRPFIEEKRSPKKSPKKKAKKIKKANGRNSKTQQADSNPEESSSESEGETPEPASKKAKTAKAERRWRVVITLPLRGGNSIVLHGIASGVRLILFCQ
jgi:hypothetical protein